MTIPVAASHADNGSKGDSTAASSPSASAASNTVSVTAPIAKADGTKVVTARAASLQARKSALAKSDTPAKSRKQQQSQAYKTVEEYWTPERMAKAKPAPVLGSDSVKASAERNVAKAEQALKNGDKLANDKLSRANGRIFYRGDDGADYACTGSAVSSPTKRIVVTAGHCVHGGKGHKWHTNWMFVPSYDNHNKPYGTFHAQYMHTLRDWVNNGDDQTSGARKFKGYASDVGFVTVKDNEQGKHLTDVVGGHKLVTGKTSKFNATVFGYPSNLNNGESLQICNGNTFALQGGDKLSFNGVKGCNFGPGASGGPWLENYNGVTGTGEIRSVTSFVETEASAPTKYIDNGGPHFDKRVKGLFDLANNDK